MKGGIMTITDERQKLVELVVDKECSDLRAREATELRRLYYSMERQGPWKSELNHKHAEHMHKLGKFIATKHLEASRKERNALGYNDIPLIMAKIDYRFNQATNDLAQKLHEFS